MKCTRRTFMLIPAPAALALAGLGPASFGIARAGASHLLDATPVLAAHVSTPFLHVALTLA